MSFTFFSGGRGALSDAAPKVSYLGQQASEDLRCGEALLY